MTYNITQVCPSIQRTLLAMSERTVLSVSQVTDEFLYAKPLLHYAPLPKITWRSSSLFKNWCFTMMVLIVSFVYQNIDKL